MNSRIVYTPPEPKRLKKNSQKSKKNILFFGLEIVLFLGIATGLIYLTRLPYWQIKKIEFSGLGVLSETELREKLEERLRGNHFFTIPKTFYLLVNIDSLSAPLAKKYPRIEKIVITKTFPNTLKIDIRERELFGILCPRLVEEKTPEANGQESRNCVFVDKNGVAYEEAPHAAGSLITKIETDVSPLELNSTVLNPEVILKMREVAAKFKERLGSVITSYQLFSKIPREFRTTTAEGYQLYLNKEDDFNGVFKILKTVLEKEVKDRRPQLDYVDLRFGNKVFYKFKTGTPPPPPTPKTENQTATSSPE